MKMKMNMKKISISLSVILIVALLAGCGKTDKSIKTSPEAESSTSTPMALSANITDRDKNTAWIESDTRITLDNSSISVSGTGATSNGKVVTITKEGTYVISGTISDGQIVIAATNSDKVHLVLNGADITNKTGAPIYSSQCDKLIITLAEGTKNVLTDGSSNFQYANTEEEPNAALFSKDDLTINGTGSLIVNAGFKNGICSKDDLLIVSGDISVNAANHGIRGNDSVTILNGNIDIVAVNDGIQTNNTEDTSLGWILIENGTVTITAGHDGIQADTQVSISDGEFSITTGENSSSSTDSDSYKCIKSTTDIIITGGSFVIDSEDDGVHANGNIKIDGGTFTISSGDDGIHADGNLTVNSGTIKIAEAYEGLEAAKLAINGGAINIVSSDDALNAAGGKDQSGGGGRFGMDMFAANSAYDITISGGSINFLAGGDGMDSNGTVNITDGEIVAIINSSPDNGAIDANGTTTFTGGIIIYGGTGTGSTPNNDSTQSYVYVSSEITAGNEISVKKDGQTLIAYTPETNLRSLALSSPDIKSGEIYEVYSGDSLLSTVTAGTGGGGWMNGPGQMGAPGGRGGRGGEGNPGMKDPGRR